MSETDFSIAVDRAGDELRIRLQHGEFTTSHHIPLDALQCEPLQHAQRALRSALATLDDTRAENDDLYGELERLRRALERERQLHQAEPPASAVAAAAHLPASAPTISRSVCEFIASDQPLPEATESVPEARETPDQPVLVAEHSPVPNSADLVLSTLGTVCQQVSTERDRLEGEVAALRSELAAANQRLNVEIAARRRIQERAQEAAQVWPALQRLALVYREERIPLLGMSAETEDAIESLLALLPA